MVVTLCYLKKKKIGRAFEINVDVEVVVRDC